MIVDGKDRPAKEGESRLMRGDGSSEVQWVINCGGGKGEGILVGMMRNTGVMKRIGGWSFQAKHVRGVENVISDGITRCKEGETENHADRGMPHRFMTGSGARSRRNGDVFRTFGRGYVLVRVAKSTRKTYAQG